MTSMITVNVDHNLSTTPTHTLGLSHIVWMILYSRRTREHLPRRKGLRGGDGKPYWWRLSYVRRKREKGISEQTSSHKPKCMQALTHTKMENKVSLTYILIKHYIHTLYRLRRISVTVIHDICSQRSALCRPSQ